MLKVGDAVVVNGHPARVTVVHNHADGLMQGMIDVAFDHGRGGVCVSASEALPGEVWPQMVQIAASDLRRARKEGSILISDTREGSVELRFVFTEKRFEVHTLGIHTKCVMWIPTGKKSAEQLAPLYKIETA